MGSMACAPRGLLGVEGTRAVIAQSIAVVDLGGPKVVHGDDKRVRTVVTPHIDDMDTG